MLIGNRQAHAQLLTSDGHWSAFIADEDLWILDTILQQVSTCCPFRHLQDINQTLAIFSFIWFSPFQWDAGEGIYKINAEPKLILKCWKLGSGIGIQLVLAIFQVVTLIPEVRNVKQAQKYLLTFEDPSDNRIQMTFLWGISTYIIGNYIDCEVSRINL